MRIAVFIFVLRTSDFLGRQFLDKNTIVIVLLLSFNFLAIFLVDLPENVRLTTNASNNECTGVVIHFTCTAEANPAVHTYLLHENDIVIRSMSISGTWIKTVEIAGMFVFRCEANNSIQGIGKSNDAILTVDGEFDLVK